MNKNFIKSVSAGILGLSLIASCSMNNKESHKCSSAKCSAKKVEETNNCSANQKEEAAKCSANKTKENHKCSAAAKENSKCSATKAKK